MEAGRVTALAKNDLKRISQALEGLDEIKVDKSDVKGFEKNMNLVRSYKIEELDQIKVDEDSMIKRACLFPPYQQLEYFAGKIKDLRGQVHFGEVLRNFDRMITLSNNFFLRHRKFEIFIADILETVPYLTLKERHFFTMVPMNSRASNRTDLEQHYFQNVTFMDKRMRSNVMFNFIEMVR